MGRFDSPLSVATLFIGATCVSVALIFLFDAEATSRINREKIAGKQVISASREERKEAEAAGRTENLERIQDSEEKVESVTWDVRSEDGGESSTTEKDDESILVFFKRKLKNLFKRHHRWKRSLKEEESDEETSDEDPREPVALFLTQKFPLADYNRGEASSLALSASSASTSSTGLGGGNGANANSNGLESGGKSGVHPGVSSGGFHKIRHAMKKLGSGGLDLSMVERMILDSNPSRTRNSDDNPEGDRKGNYHGFPASGGAGHGRPKPPPPPLLPNNDDKSERELSSARRISPPLLNPFSMEAGGESKRISSSGSGTNFERESTTWSSWISRSGGSSNLGRNTVTGPGSGTGNLSESVERDRRASSGSTTATPTTPSKAWKERDGAEKGSGHGVWNSLKNGRQRFRLDSPADLEQEKEGKGGRGAGSSVILSEDSLESFAPPRDLDEEAGVGSGGAGNLGSDGGRKRIITTNNDQGPQSFVPQHHHSGHYHEDGEEDRGKERKEGEEDSSWGHKRGPFLAGIAGGRNSADHTDIFAYPPGYVTSENHVREENLQARHSGGSLHSKGYYSEEDGDEEEGKEGKSGDGLEEGEDSSHEDETDSNGTKDEGDNIYMTDTKRSILKENVEICYKTDDVLIVVAITCCLNFAFVLVIWGCVRWFSISSSAKDREFHHLDCEDGGDSILFHEDGVDGGGGRDDHEEDCCWKRRVCIDFEGGGSGGGGDMTSLKRKACREKVVAGLDGGFGKGGLMGDDKRARVGELIEESKISSSPSSFMPSSILSLGRTEENEDEKLLSPLALPFPKSRVPSLRRPSDRFHFVLQKHYQRNLKEFGLGFIPPYNCSSGAEDGERESVCNFDNDRSSLYNQGNYYPRPSNRPRGRGAADKESSTRSRTNNIILPPTRTSTSMYSIRVCDNKLVPRKSGKTSGGLASSYSSSSSNSSSPSSSSSSTSSSLKKRTKRRKNGEKCYSHSMEDLRYIRT